MKKIALMLASAALLLAGCSSSGQDTLTVFAASSLKNTFTELGKQFEADHPGTTVTFNFAGSSDLVAQLQQGAPADVFASADEANMQKAGDLVKSPTNFATNSMMIAVPPDNPASIQEFADLSDAQVVVCAPEVPCGAATEKIEQNSGVTLKPVSEEASVTDVLNKVTTGEADAGVVYVTDVQAAGDKVQSIKIPTDVNAVNTYPIAVVAGSEQTTLAQDFANLVTGPEGQKVMSDAGFGAP